MTESHPSADDFQLRHAAITDLQASLLTTKTVEGYLQQVVDRAADHVAPKADCSLTLLRNGRFSCVASSDDLVLEADQAEYEARSGPCVEAAIRGTENVIADLRSENRWPTWTATSLRLGYLSAAGVPADSGDGAQLALDLYAREADAFGDDQMRRARLYAEEAARTLRLCLILAREAALADQLQTAMVSRSTIDQAVGVIMGQNRIPQEQAFAILRAASQHQNVKLRDVARTVIENLTGHAPSETKGFEQH